jgi:hypothetical protein
VSLKKEEEIRDEMRSTRKHGKSVGKKERKRPHFVGLRLIAPAPIMAPSCCICERIALFFCCYFGSNRKKKMA